MKPGEDRGNDGRVENEENQTQVSLPFPRPLEIATRFPHSHRPYGFCVSNLQNQIKKGDPGGGSLRSRLQAHSSMRKCCGVDSGVDSGFPAVSLPDRKVPVVAK
jgi:hypothetical protein